MTSDNALNALKLAWAGHNLAILGQAGTGKTCLISQILDSYNGKTIAATCSTGTACLQLKNARTLHSWAGLDDGRHTTARLLDLLNHDPRKAGARQRILTVDVLIIDEISMISAAILSTLEETCRKVRNVETAFGGIQVIVVGDFLQLLPVRNLTYGDPGDPAFKSPAWAAIKHTIVLTDVHRQDDPDFIKTIHDISRGELTAESLNFLKSVQRPIQHGSEHVFCLFARNVEVSKYNNEQLILNGGPQKKYHSNDEGDHRYLDRMQAPRILAIRRGCPVMLLVNIFERKLVNGSLGKVMDFSDDDVMVHFSDADEHIKIKRTQFSDFDPRQGKNRASRLQFPLKLAYGMTIHKSQGMTLPFVRIDCSLIDVPGMLGVAVGRCRTSSGLEVRNFSQRAIVKQPNDIIAMYQDQVSDEDINNASCCQDIGAPIEYDYGDLEGYGEHKDEELDDETLVNYVAFVEEAFNEELYAENQNEPSTSHAHDQNKKQKVSHKLPADFLIDDMIEIIKFQKVLSGKQQTFNDFADQLKTNAKFPEFCESQFSILMELHQSLITKIPSQSNQITSYHKALSSLLSGKDHFHRIERLIESNPEAIHINLIWNIMYHLSSIVDTIRQEQAGIAVSNKFSNARISMSSQVLSKLRYISGYILASLQNDLLRKMKVQSESLDMQILSKYDECHEQLMALRSLTRTQQQIEAQTDLPETLEEVREKQYPGAGGLTNVSDETFNFFKHLCETCMESMHSHTMAAHGEKAHESIVQILLQNQSLESEFLTLFGVDYSSVMPFLLREIVMKFTRTLMRQWRKDIMVAEVEKKLQHRKQIMVSTGTPAPMKTGAPAGVGTFTHESEFVTKLKSLSDQKLMKLCKKDLQNLCVNIGVPENGTKAQLIKNIRQSSESPKLDKLSHELSADGLKVLGLSETSKELCKFCKKEYAEEDLEWIMCSKCQCWIHRLCAGIDSDEQWNIFSKEDEDYICKECTPL